jgi:hypothetical protein
MEPTGGRRNYDSDLSYLEESLKRWVSEEIGQTRHLMRNEIAAVSAQVAALTLSSTKEHAEVKAALAQLQAGMASAVALEARVDTIERKAADVETLAQVTGRVQRLESASGADQASATAIDKLRTRLVWYAFGIIGAVGTIAALLR